MQYEEEVAAEVLVKRGVKKKLPGFVFLLDLAVVVTVQKAGQKGTIDQDMPGILKLKKMSPSDFRATFAANQTVRMAG